MIFFFFLFGKFLFTIQRVFTFFQQQQKRESTENVFEKNKFVSKNKNKQFT